MSENPKLHTIPDFLRTITPQLALKRVPFIELLHMRNAFVNAIKAFVILKQMVLRI